EVLVLFGGAINAKSGGQLAHTPLLKTGEMAGLISYQEVMAYQQAVRRRENPDLRSATGAPTGPQTLAMAIESAAAEKAGSNGTDAVMQEDSESDDQSASQGIKVVYVADTDLMIPDFLQIRADPNQTQDVRFQMQNVTFLLNAFDWLAGEEEYMEIRKHQPSISSLQLIEEVKNEAKRQETEKAAEFDRQLQESRRTEQETRTAKIMELQEDIQDLQRKSREPGADQVELRQQLQQKVQDFQRRQAIEERRARVAEETSEQAKQKHRTEIRREADKQVERIQNAVKAAAVTLPCIPPLLIGVIVFASGRLRERENISKSRLK
ncbi:MAG: ABC transporter permease, partial [Candidatus Paceibacterota bacterium]